MTKKKRRYPQDYPLFYPPTGTYARFMEPDDILGSSIDCEDCKQMHKVVEVGPVNVGINPDDGRPDRWFLVKFDSGESARFWTDNKVILGPEGDANNTA